MFLHYLINKIILLLFFFACLQSLVFLFCDVFIIDSSVTILVLLFIKFKYVLILHVNTWAIACTHSILYLTLLNIIGIQRVDYDLTILRFIS